MQQQEKDIIRENELWINVFVHGTHGSLLSILSLFKVLKDDSENTLYRKLQDQGRKYNAFYFNRFMSLPGLHRVSVEKRMLKKIKSVTVPIVQAYDQMVRVIDGTDSNHEYYTFGWNGLLSQKERRLEAIRLYNELSALVQDFKKKGVIPKIRLLAFSHGGNLCLNLAPIYEILRDAFPGQQHENESLHKMDTLINSLDTMRLQINDDEKKWYQKPTDNTMIIDEMILMATPIQQETEPFCFSPFFKKIVNCYSDNDTIQKSDFISTNEKKSRNKITQKDNEKNPAHIKQVRIMVDHCMTNDGDELLKLSGFKNFVNNLVKKKVSIKSLLRGGKLVSENPNDPGHADFWCVDWNKKDTFYDPLPLVVLMPLIINALESIDTHDLDLNLLVTSDDACFDLYAYNSRIVLGQSLWPLSFINQVRDAFVRAKNLKKVFNFSFSFGG